MGDPKRQRKKFDTPRFPWQIDALEAELKLLGEYGLRNKREIWRHKTLLSKYRGIGRSLLGKSADERSIQEKQLLHRLNRLGILHEESELDDVLDLTLENILDRRLQTLVFRRGLAQTMQQSRQLIAHGHVSINGQKVSAPSYLVLREEEDKIEYSPKSPLTSPDHPITRAASIPGEPMMGEEEETKNE
ncbi:MAG: 30S ribosomal protein S4 [Candidatus Bathyarchaeota archaeon]|nr:30S ribosomal protein S4 [Candidatus Bathyarchaeum tardum]WGM89593.1 MAG: 30S ribosomal protein S4 [Candidatus Bathyarchaeum tardum]WNZ30304.1 MAG: 30S ribosomal protein S4 [Candidatus Bathyarchaeota archaeon]